MSEAINSDKLDALILSTDEMTESNNALALAMVEYQERAKTAARRFRVTIGIMFATIALVLGGVVAELNGSHAARDLIIDCVQPTGKCYQDGQARTAKAIGSINEVSVLAAACAPNYVNLPLPQRVAAIEACIKRRVH